MSSAILIPDPAATRDLVTFLSRLSQVGLPQVRLQFRAAVGGSTSTASFENKAPNGVLALTGCTMEPQMILDATPTVMVQRAVPAVSDAGAVEKVVLAKALTERFARAADDCEFLLQLPPSETTAVWAGVSPPVSGWQFAGTVTAQSLRDVANAGMREISEALPAGSGQPVVQKLRSEVWGRSVLDGVPAGAAFSLETLGFLEGEREVKLFQAPGWSRLTTKYGAVIVRV